MKNLLRLLLKISSKQKPISSQSDQGFTLIELLVAMIVTFLILTPMLGFVVNMLNNDRAEQVKAMTEQEVQSAVDFIAQDLSQAVYIYDNNGINNADGKNESSAKIADSLNLLGVTGGTPILVFWKRQIRRDVLPISACSPESPPSVNDCKDDTFIYSLVAYYLVQDSSTLWCQPAGGTCPSRIERYEIRDGVLKPDIVPSNPATASDYVSNDEVPNNGFKLFDLQATVQATNVLRFPQGQMNQWLSDGLGPSLGNAASAPSTLVNYIDSGNAPNAATDECKTLLNAPTYADETEIPETALKVGDPQKGFYACVDSSKTIARIMIRGNALRRLQSNAPYSDSNNAYFPRASVQVQGLGGLGD